MRRQELLLWRLKSLITPRMDSKISLEIDQALIKQDLGIYVALIQYFRLIMIKSENISIAKSVSTACQYSTNKCQI